VQPELRNENTMENADCRNMTPDKKQTLVSHKKQMDSSYQPNLDVMDNCFAQYTAHISCSSSAGRQNLTNSLYTFLDGFFRLKINVVRPSY
jgi:hypothetical protein